MWLKPGEIKKINGVDLIGTPIFYKVFGYITFESNDYSNQLVKRVYNSIIPQYIKPDMKTDYPKVCKPGIFDSHGGLDGFSYTVPNSIREEYNLNTDIEVFVSTIGEFGKNNSVRGKYQYGALPFDSRKKKEKSIYITYAVYDTTVCDNVVDKEKAQLDLDSAVIAANKDINSIIQKINDNGYKCKFEPMNMYDDKLQYLSIL